MPVTVRTCFCDSPYQDARYGRKRRVMNPTDKEDTVRCTICDTERPAREAVAIVQTGDVKKKKFKKGGKPKKGGKKE